MSMLPITMFPLYTNLSRRYVSKWKSPWKRLVNNTGSSKYLLEIICCSQNISNHIQDFIDEEVTLSTGAITTSCFEKKELFCIILWSTVQHDILSHVAVINNYYGWLDSRIIDGSIRYYTSSKNKLHQIIRIIIQGVNGGSDKRFLHTKYIDW